MRLADALSKLDQTPPVCPADGKILLAESYFDETEHRFYICPEAHVWPLHMTDRDIWDPDPEIIEEQLEKYCAEVEADS